MKISALIFTSIYILCLDFNILSGNDDTELVATFSGFNDDSINMGKIRTRMKLETATAQLQMFKSMELFVYCAIFFITTLSGIHYAGK